MLNIYFVVVEMVATLAPAVGQIGRHDADLARQMKRALCSVPLNLAEAHQSLGGDPGKSPKGDNARARYHTALGSMRETKACIDVARALGYVEPLDAGVADRIDHVSATLYRLAHPKK